MLLPSPLVFQHSLGVPRPQVAQGGYRDGGGLALGEADLPTLFGGSASSHPFATLYLRAGHGDAVSACGPLATRLRRAAGKLVIRPAPAAP